jgi:hypothetical protein
MKTQLLGQFLKRLLSFKQFCAYFCENVIAKISYEKRECDFQDCFLALF